MSNYRKLITFLVTQVFFCIYVNAEINFMKLNEGQEKCDHITPYENPESFIPYSKAFIRNGSFFSFITPKNSQKKNSYFTRLAKVSVEPKTIYTLKLTALGSEKLYILITGLFFKNGKYIGTRSVFRHIYLQNVNGMTSVEKDFAIPTGVDSMILNLTMNSNATLIIKEFAIRKKGRIKIPPSGYLGKNLLPIGDFKNCQLGEFTGMYKGRGKNAKHWPNIKADVVELNGEKCLKIERNTQNYIYPFFTSVPFPFNPQNYLIKASVTVRGKGEFRLGLWWKRKGIPRDYQNRVKCVLSDKWTTFTEIRACLSPLVTNANLSFYSTGNAVIYVKNIKIEFID